VYILLVRSCRSPIKR